MDVRLTVGFPARWDQTVSYDSRALDGSLNHKGSVKYNLPFGRPDQDEAGVARTAAFLHEGPVR